MFKTQSPTLKDIVLGDLRRYRVSYKALAAEMGVSESNMYSQLNNPMNLRVQGIIAIQKLTKIPYAELIQLIQSS